jgi:hypothetical protein
MPCHYTLGRVSISTTVQPATAGAIVVVVTRVSQRRFRWLSFSVAVLSPAAASWGEVPALIPVFLRMVACTKGSRRGAGAGSPGTGDLRRYGAGHRHSLC